MAVPGTTPTRVLIESGVLVRTVAIYARLAGDDAVEAIALDVDPWTPAAYDDE